MLFGVKLGHKIGFKLTSVISTTIFSGCMFLCSYSPNIYVFLVLYGIINPFAVGVQFLLPIHCGVTYFPKHKGLVVGLLTGTFSLSLCIFGFVSTWIINPDNLDPTIIVHEGN